MEPKALSKTLQRIANNIEMYEFPDLDSTMSAISDVLLFLESPSDNGFNVPDSEVVGLLNEWLGAKYTIDIAYRNFADRVKGPWRDSIAGHWYEHAQEERDSAYAISMKIISLGYEPTQTATDVPSVPSNLQSFGSALMELELQALEKAQNVVDMAGTNAPLKVMAEDIMLKDAHHLDDLVRLCAEFDIS